MVLDDVIINKSEAIKYCVKRVNEEYNNNAKNLQDITTQDSIVLNLQRAFETAIDLAMHLVRKKSLGAPQNSREAFEKLEQAGIINKNLAQNLKNMVGFRNIAVHSYHKLEIEIIDSIIKKQLGDFLKLIKALKAA